LFEGVVVTEESYVDLIKGLKKSEEELLKTAEALQGRVHTAAARLLFADMRLTIFKHVKIFEEMMNAVKEGVPPENLWDTRIATYVDKLVVRRELDRHILLEEAALGNLIKTIASTKDETMKLLLTHIINDIREHHKTVQLIIKRNYAF